MIILCIIIYWFIAFSIQLGIEIVSDEVKDTKQIVVESIFIGWLILPVEIGEVIGYILSKIKYDN